MIQIVYVDGLNYLDQLKDYVQTSLSSKQNVQAVIVQKVEQRDYVKDCEYSEQYRDPLSLDEKEKSGEANKTVEQTIVVKIKNEEIMEEVEPSAESTDLIDEVKEEITNEGTIFSNMLECQICLTYFMR